jgi:hypothetical protein
LVKEGARNKEANLAHSHLYKTGGTLVATFQRIDIPILRQFDQYNYVLFTGGHTCPPPILLPVRLSRAGTGT